MAVPAAVVLVIVLVPRLAAVTIDAATICPGVVVIVAENEFEWWQQWWLWM